MQICDFMKYVPINLSIHGGRRDKLLNLFSKLFKLDEGIEYFIKKENISINPRNISEQVMYYFFYNLLRGYKQSPLAIYLKNKVQSSNSRFIFVDIGANLGFYGLLMKKSGNTVLSFEPDPIHFSFLDRNKNIFSDITYNLALSSSEGNADFFISESNPGANSLIMSDLGWSNSGYFTKTIVSMKRFDQVITDDNQLSKIKIIKIDVEGAEADVIEGMTGIFKKGYKPEIWCEVRGGKSDRNPNSYLKVINTVKLYGYKPYIYTNTYTLKPFSEKDVSQVFDLLLIAS